MAWQSFEEKLTFGCYALTQRGYRFTDQMKTASADDKVEMKYRDRFVSVKMKT
jgi:hypothetical protein